MLRRKNGFEWREVIDYYVRPIRKSGYRKFRHWQADYCISWNEDIATDLQNSTVQMKLFQSAMKKGDKVTQVAALVVARSFLMNLEGFFRGLRKDVEKMGWSREF